jgi:succinylarginine dihydrolase
MFARQNPEAIDAGVFHNDVISVGNKNVFLYHSLGFADLGTALDGMRRKLAECCNEELIAIEVKPDELSLNEAVETYFFNSQLVSLPDDSMCLIAPVECLENPKTKALLDKIISGDNPINQVQYMDVRQSMKNGGGPACLRLRVVLTEAELSLVRQGVLLTDDLYEKLVNWAEKQYREELHLDDLANPNLIMDCHSALDELTNILQLGSIYGFQKTVR